MPDLNSVPASPHALAHSRRQSAQPVATHASTSNDASDASLNILPSNQDAVNHPNASYPELSTEGGHVPQSLSDAAVGTGPGPLRHPRPLTATELHMELEKEQEAVVNRLTRELSLLRAAQNASVVSNASSTSGGASAHDQANDTSLLSGSGFSIPATRRHTRTSSTASNTALQLASSVEGRVSSSAPRPVNPATLSRQNSTTSRTSQATSPLPQSSLDPSNYFQQRRTPATSSQAHHAPTATPGSAGFQEQLSPGLMQATTRYEETAFHRGELEAAKRENEILKRRVRELERRVRERRASGSSRTRSDSVSTTASISAGQPGGVAGIAGPRDTPARPERDRGLTMQSVTSTAGSVGTGIPEDEVMVGESAASTSRT